MLPVKIVRHKRYKRIDRQNIFYFLSWIMKYIMSLISISLSVFLFLLFASTVSAHVPFGAYAGTHAVAFVPQPGSPFVDEMVEMDFFLRDLMGNFPSELFTVQVVIQKKLPDDSEQNIAELTPKMESPGIYTTQFRFDEGGHYRVEFLFNKINEPDIVRDAVFDIEVRVIPSRGVSYFLIAIVSIIVFLSSFLGGMAFARRGRARR